MEYLREIVEDDGMVGVPEEDGAVPEVNGPVGVFVVYGVGVAEDDGSTQECQPKIFT